MENFTIYEITQIALDTLEITLSDPIDVQALKQEIFSVTINDEDVSDKFLSIDESNDFVFNEVITFQLKIKQGEKIKSSSCILTMSNDIASHTKAFGIGLMYGVDGIITSIDRTSMYGLTLHFSTEVDSEVLPYLELEVSNQDGKKISSDFEIVPVSDTSFTTLDIIIFDGESGALESGEYSFKFKDTFLSTEVFSYNENLYTISPIPAISKVEYVINKMQKATIIVSFDPAMENSVFNHCAYSITNKKGKSVDTKFTNLSTSVVSTKESYGLTYVTSITFEFDHSNILEEDEYTITFNWNNAYSFLDSISGTVNMPLIAPAYDSIVQNGLDILYLKFSKKITKEFIEASNAKVLKVDTLTSVVDGQDIASITKTDISELFRPLSETNVFEEDADVSNITQITLQLKDTSELPSGCYEVSLYHFDTEDISEKVSDYNGSISILYMGSLSMTGDVYSIIQTDINLVSINFAKPQSIDLLSNLKLNITDIDLNEYSGCFKDILESNTVYDANNNIISQFSNSFMDSIAIGETSLPIQKCSSVNLVIGTEKAIPGKDYNVSFTLNNAPVFSGKMKTTFMTDTHPEISGIGIENSRLIVNFYPYAELSTVLISNFDIINNNGESKVDCFGTIFNSEMTQTVQNNITYVSKVSIAVKDNVSLASGQYTIKWLNNPSYFLHDLEFNGALPVVTQGVKSAMLSSNSTLAITLNEKKKVSDIIALELSVINSKNEDCTLFFKSIKDSNPNLTDVTQEIDTFNIVVSDNEDVISDEYTFSLYSEEVDGSNDPANTSVFVFSANIVYMTAEFPAIEVVDNLSSDVFVIVNITNDNVSSYIGRYIQLLTSTSKEILSSSNQSTYIGSSCKVFNTPVINEITIKFDDEIHPCLLTSSDISIVSGDGNNITDYFKSVSSSNSFTTRKVLNYIKLIFEEPQLGEYFDSCTVSITNSLGEEITSKFKSIEKCNEFPDDIKVNEVILNPTDDELIEELDSYGYSIQIQDGNKTSITKFKFITAMNEISTVNSMKLKLDNGYSISKDTYTITMSYINEPGLTGTKTIKAFSYSGQLPFLSTDIGTISMVETSDMETMKVTFSNDLPISLFSMAKLSVINADGTDISSYFKPVAESNDFNGYTLISDLLTPNVLYYKLDSGKSLDEGNYTISYTVNTSAIDDDDSNSVSTECKLFSRTSKLSYMIKELDNSIEAVTQTSIDTLKVDLKYPVDINMIRKLSVTAMNQINSLEYDVFDTPINSNNFGKSVLLTNSQYLLYSNDGNSWSRSDTKVTQSLNDIVYNEETGIYYIACNGGKILWSSSISSGWATISTGIANALNAIDYHNSLYVVIGSNGLIMTSENGTKWSNASTNTTKNLMAIDYVEDKGYFVVGEEGTILHSIDGYIWETVVSGVKNTLTAITYYSDYTTSDGDTVSVTTPGFYVSGTNGLILYSIDGISQWKELSSAVTNSLYCITSHNGTLIAVGESGTITLSMNGESWSRIESNASFTLRSISYADNSFIASGSNGKWLTSTSGSVWTTKSSIYQYAFKNITYIKSQYENNRKASYFYVKLKAREELGATNYYTGYDTVDYSGATVSGLPTLENNPASSWYSDKLKVSHIGDIYLYYKMENGVITDVLYYQFAYHQDTATYSWEECSSIPFSGNYTINVNQKDENDNDAVWHWKSNIPITYLTANPGTLKSVTFNNPDDILSYNSRYPFITVNFTNANELALYYSTFEVTKDGVDYSSYFLPIRFGDKTYSSASIRELKLYGDPEKIMSIPSGTYKFKWIWTYGKEYEDSETCEFVINEPSSVVESITRKPGTIDTLIVKFAKKIPLSYFTDTSYPASLYVFKQPKHVSDDTTTNYISSFKSVIESTPFSSIVFTEGGIQYTDQIYLTLLENTTLVEGSYMFKMKNEHYPLDDHLTKTNVTTSTFTLSQMITSDAPSISSVTFLDYKNTLATLDGHTPNQYNGTENPSIYDNLTSSWILLGDATCNAHVGDVYTNTSTNESWTFICEAYQYFWKQNISKPNISVTFRTLPSLSDVLSSQPIKLISNSGEDYSSLFEEDPGNWNYSKTTKDGTVYVSNVYIPLDESKSFPGGDNLSFTWTWETESAFTPITLDGLTFKSAMHDYGVISSFASSGENILNISFSNAQAVTFVKDLNWNLIYHTIDDDGQEAEEDVSNLFYSITESNDFSGVTRVKDIYLVLLPEMSLYSGLYTLTMSGQKDASDLLTNPDQSEIQEFTIDSQLTYISSAPPETIQASIITTASKVDRPALVIDFNGVMPELKSTQGFSVNIYKEDEGTTIDYGSWAFCDAGSNYVSYTTTSSKNVDLVGSIEIPMKDTTALSPGNYDVTFNFPSGVFIEPISIEVKATTTTPEKLSTFNVSDYITSPLGKIHSVKTNGTNELVISLSLHPSVINMTALLITQLGQILKKELHVKNYGDIYDNLTFAITDGLGANQITAFKTKIQATETTVTLTLRANSKFSPGPYTVTAKWGGCDILTPWTGDIGGLICNKIVNTSNDKICYILKETYDGKEKTKVFSSYSKMKARITRMSNLNAATTAQYTACKKCRKKKLFSTSKIKAQLEKYDFLSGNISSAMNTLANGYYKKIVAPQVNCENCDFDDATSDFREIGKKTFESVECEGYVAVNKLYTWTTDIATYSGKYPRGGSKRIYFRYITVNGIQIARGFKASAKGKPTSAYKKYTKKLKAYIKKYKKKVAVCKKCKKKAIAYKANNSIGWNSALFPLDIKANTSIANALTKKFTKVFKKKTMGCASANFTLVKKNASYCKLSCSKAKVADPKMDIGSFKGIFRK